MSRSTEKFAYRVELDGKSANEAVDILKKKAVELRDEMKRLKQANDLAGFENVERQAKSVQRELKRYEMAVFDVQKVLNNLSGVTQRDLITTQRKLSAQIKDELIPGTNEYSEALKKLALVQKQIKANQSAISQADQGKGFFSKMADSVNKYALVVGSAIFGLNSMKSKVEDAVNAFNEFEQAKAELQSLTGVTNQTRDEIGKFAQELSTSVTDGGVRITKSANEIIDGFKKVGSQAPELLKDSVALQQVTKDALILAEASGGPLDQNVQGLTTTLNQFGLISNDTNTTIRESSRVINVLAAASQAGAGEIPYLQEAMEKGGAQAHMFGVSLETTAGIIETLAPFITEAGKAGTALRNVFLKLETQTNDQFKPSVVGYTTAMENLAKANLNATQLTKLFGEENFTAGKLLIDHRNETVKYTEAVTNSNKAVEQATINTDTNTAKLAQAKNETIKQAVALGEKLAPALLLVTVSAGKLLGSLNGILDALGLGRTEIEKFSDSFNEQKQVVESLDKSVVPYLDKIDKLKAKMNPTAKEQDELKNAIAKVGEALPMATTSVDDYGVALNVSTEKAREFIRAQKALMASINADQINAQQEALDKLKKQQADLTFKADYQRASVMRGADEVVANAKLKELNHDLTSINAKIADAELIIKKLSGGFINEPTTTNTSGGNTGNEPGGTGKATDDQLKALENAKDRLVEINNQIQTSLKVGIDKEVFSIYQKYEKEINLAKANENTKTELGKQWGKLRAELEESRSVETAEAIRKFETDAETKKQGELDAIAQKAQEKRDAELKRDQEAANALLLKYIGSKEQSELELLEKFHNEKLISEEDYQKALAAIKNKFAKDAEDKKEKDRKAQLQDMEKSIQTELAITNAFTDAVNAAKELELKKAGENEEKKKEIAKKYADIEFAMNAAKIIGATALAVVKALELGFVAGPIAAALIGASGALQLGISNKERERVKGFEHGYYGVTRTDGMEYRASVSSDTSTQMVSKPTVFLAGEGGFPEMIIDGNTLRNMQINYPDAIAAIHKSRMLGYESGSYAKNTTSTHSEVIKEVKDAEMIRLLHDLNTALKAGIKTIFSYRDFKDLTNKIDTQKTDFN